MSPPLHKLSAQLTAVLNAARAASDSAYSVYSGFSVGAAILSESGAIYSGCNVENASYSLSTCAEQAAIASARLAEGSKLRISAVVVYAHEAGRQCSCSPCGGCRQRIRELGAGVLVFYYDERLELIERRSDQLLPESFVLNI